MLITDFFDVRTKIGKGSVVIVYPDFKVGKFKDLMVRGKAFYSIFDKETNMWSTDEYDVQRLVDQELYKESERLKDSTDDKIVVESCSSYSSGSWKRFKEYLKNMPDNYKDLDMKITFSNDSVKRTDYVSKRVNYPLEEGDISAYDEMMSTLYDEENRAKLEWAIGAIVSGDSKKIQKFEVLYGDKGTGKSTVLNIITKLFSGYVSTFDAKSLTSSSSSFSTEAFKSNPLVAIQHDGDLSRIEDNARLNSIVSHESIIINEKYKSSYASSLSCFLFMATNRPVKITDAKSGILRRLIDVNPTGNKLPKDRYDVLYSQIDFELGAIAWHCLQVYKNLGPNYYNSYVPLDMTYKTDEFFNFVESYYLIFKNEDEVTLTQAYSMYKEYCNDSRVEHILPRYKFREELKDYFKEFHERLNTRDDRRRSVYQGFLSYKFEQRDKEDLESEQPGSWLEFEDYSGEPTELEKFLADYPAQYANDDGIPSCSWSKCKTKLRDLDTTKVHYVKVPENLICIDFDIKNDKGEKDYERNIEAASKWPPTYAEVSKSGAGIHLYYFYTGSEIENLSPVVEGSIECKVFRGNSALRRLSKSCYNVGISDISYGLPIKEEKKVINSVVVKSEKKLREQIERNLRKEIHPATKPSVDFIKKILDDAYANGLKYDVTDMRPDILAFAVNSTNHSEYCIIQVSKMKFKSDEPSMSVEFSKDAPIVFFDCEVFPNLFLVNWKYQGIDQVNRMINPSPKEIEELFKFRLIGFNNLRYDNHILYARYVGYTIDEIYNLSQKIVNGSKNCTFAEAYSISYTDIYDFASAGNKMSLKKWENKLRIHHKELNLPWDQPVPEERWVEVAEYCDNDVISTEKLFEHLTGDWTARQILADIAGLTVNDTTNTLTAQIIFGNNKHPQSEFKYRDLSKKVEYLDEDVKEFILHACPDIKGKDGSILPYFPGYKFENGKSSYQGIDPKEGGYVYSEPGVYFRVALLDVKSMHPHSVISECLFGVRYTKIFRDIVESRVAIKEKRFDEARQMLGGKLAPYIDRVEAGEMTPKDLANALKTAINSVYGLTAAKFDNAFRDQRNIDNIVAKRGALFMIDLKNAVQLKGYTVAHIKTDSIKIPDADKEIIEFVKEFGREYGYEFDHECTYDRMCLVNDAVYIAKDAETMQWSATGAQFAMPYVFKTLFSHEDLNFWDFCEERSVKSKLYLDMVDGPDEHNYVFVGKTGLFTPVKSGGGDLVVERDGKYNAVSGTKGYKWLESETVRELGREDDVDISYYDRFAEEAKADIEQYYSFSSFVSDSAPWEPPCGRTDIDVCLKCNNYIIGSESCVLKYKTDPIPF